MIPKTTEPTITIRMKRATAKRMKVIAAYKGTTMLELFEIMSQEAIKEFDDFNKKVPARI